MRVVLQRISRARVTIEGEVAGQVGRGLLLLVAFSPSDDEETLEWMTGKILELRVFADEEGKMNRSLLDVGGAVLVVSQFTLYGDTRKGRRPSFVSAASPEVAVPLYESLLSRLETRLPGRVESGRFGAMMEVESVNDGPVTLLLER